MDALDQGVRVVLDRMRKKLKVGQTAFDREVKAAMSRMDTKLSQASFDLSNAGVPISYSPAERAAELDDPSGAGITARIAATPQLGASTDLGGPCGGGEYDSSCLYAGSSDQPYVPPPPAPPVTYLSLIHI